MFHFLKKQRKVAISWVLGRIFPLVFTATRVTYMFACVSFPNMSFQVLILLLPIQSPLSISLFKITEIPTRSSFRMRVFLSS